MLTFSDLIGQIYDSAIDPEMWRDALVNIAAFTEVDRVTLILEDALEPTKSVFYLSYEDPPWDTRYLQTYLLLNPMRLATVALSKPGDVILTSDFMSHDEYSRSRFYREFLAERQIVDVAVAILEKTATTITVLSVTRKHSQGVADERLRRKLELIYPHVRRAAAIARILEQRKIEAASLGETLDQLQSAVFLMDQNGVMLHANDAAGRLVAEGVIVSRVGGQLLIRDAVARQALKEALASARRGDADLESSGLSIPLTSGNDKAWVGTLMPLGGGNRRAAGLVHQAAAALCLTEVKYQRPSGATELTRIYGLSPREVMVLLAIVENGGIPEVSKILGISEWTVRSHVDSVFRKTGTKRQADLVKLIAAVMTPFG